MAGDPAAGCPGASVLQRASALEVTVHVHQFFVDGHEFLLQGPRSLIWQEDSPHLQDFQETVRVMDSCHITTGARPRVRCHLHLPP